MAWLQPVTGAELLLLSVTSGAAGGLASSEKDMLLLFRQISLVSMESGAVNLQKLPSPGDST